MKKMMVLLTSLAIVSCSSGEKTSTLGTENQLGKDKVTALAYTKEILSNDNAKKVSVAPDNKTYLIVRLEGDCPKCYAELLDGETKIEEVDNKKISNFKSEDAKGLGSKADENFYLVDKNYESLTLLVKRMGGDQVTITLKDLEEKSDRKVNTTMMAFKNEFSKPTNLLEVVKKYTQKDPNEIVREKGSDVPSSPMTKGMEIKYISEDGNYYKCNGQFLGADYPVEIWWNNNEIEKLTFKL